MNELDDRHELAALVNEWQDEGAVEGVTYNYDLADRFIAAGFARPFSKG